MAVAVAVPLQLGLGWIFLCVLPTQLGGARVAVPQDGRGDVTPMDPDLLRQKSNESNVEQAPKSPRGSNGHCPIALEKYEYPTEPYLMNWTTWWQKANVVQEEVRKLSWPHSSVLIVYHPGTGATGARVLGKYFAHSGYKPVFSEDVLRRQTDHAIRTAVLGAHAVVLVESNGLMNYTPVLTSLYFAIKEGVPIIPYDLPGFDFDEFGHSCYFLDRTLLPGQIEELEGCDVDISNLTWYVGSSLPFIISEDFNPTGARGNGEVNIHSSPIRSSFQQQLDSGFRFVVPGMPKDAFFYWRDMWSTGQNPRIRPYTLDSRFFVTYISHHISTSGPEARLLTMILWSDFSFGNIFLDVNDFHDTRSDPSNVAQSCTFLLLLDSTTFSRSFCLLETFWALKSGRPVILVAIEGKGYDAAATRRFLGNFTREAPEVLGAGGVQMIHQFGEDLDEMEYWLASTIPSLDVLPFHPGSSSEEVHGQVARMVSAMRLTTVSSPGTSKEAYFAAKL